MVSEGDQLLRQGVQRQRPLVHRHPLHLLLLLALLILPAVKTQDACYQPRRSHSRCSGLSNRYRTITGECNNVGDPTWGASGTTLRRLVANDYSDHRGSPRGALASGSLPNARFVSQANHPDDDRPDERFTHMVMQFGQFLDHDITLTPMNEETDCCDLSVSATNADCLPISVPSGDRFFSWVNSTANCINMVRSTPVCNQAIREQYNELTAFVDASQVYGSSEEVARLLRAGVDGRLKINQATNQLPTRSQLGLPSNDRKTPPDRPHDFVAGDRRSNEQPFLTALHVVFTREHNRVAKLLRDLLPPHLRTDHILYEESRRIVSAEMENIVYGEYLPTILGAEVMKKYKLILEDETSYESDVDPSVFNGFATAAFRFGHSMINGMFKLVSQRGSSERAGSQRDVYWLWRLREVFNGQSVRGARLPLENMLEGLVTQMPQTCDAYFSTEITDHLFQKNGLRENFGLDLLSLNIQRGRDHGIPGYNVYRQWCGLKALSSWTSVPEELTDAYWTQLRGVYGHVDDIDLYVGGVAEKSVKGGVVGPTFACLIGEQFSRLKRGDRFFFTHTFNMGVVSKENVLHRTLGDVLCDNTALQSLQQWVTLQPNAEYNRQVDCSRHTKLNMRAIAAEIAKELKSVNDTRRGSTGAGLNVNVLGSRRSNLFNRLQSPKAKSSCNRNRC